jgi:hypothetical protein
MGSSTKPVAAVGPASRTCAFSSARTAVHPQLTVADCFMLPDCNAVHLQDDGGARPRMPVAACVSTLSGCRCVRVTRACSKPCCALRPQSPDAIFAGAEPQVVQTLTPPACATARKFLSMGRQAIAAMPLTPAFASRSGTSSAGAA